jgi:hypothetical protein
VVVVIMFQLVCNMAVQRHKGGTLCGRTHHWTLLVKRDAVPCMAAVVQSSERICLAYAQLDRGCNISSALRRSSAPSLHGVLLAAVPFPAPSPSALTHLPLSHNTAHSYLYTH